MPGQHRNKGKPFWKFKNLAAGEAELRLYGTISERTWYEDDVTPKRFLDDLQALGPLKKLTVRINSGGGDVFAAQTIGNNLEDCGAETTCRIDGLCASAATIIACHCDKVVAAKDSTYMIHPPTVGAFDYYEEGKLRSLADAAKAVRTNILTMYAEKTGRPEDELAEEMDRTSWWTAQQAMEHGFVDEINEGSAPAVIENRAGALFVNSVDTGMDAEEAAEYFGKSQHNAGFFNTPGQESPENHEEESTMSEQITTIDQLRAAYPELVNQIESAAAEAERGRIHEIEDMTMPGGEEMANRAKFENPMSANDFARAAVKAAKQAGARFLNDARRDADGSGANGVKDEAPEADHARDAFMDAINSARDKKEG